jgi:hypothetical protein
VFLVNPTVPVGGSIFSADKRTVEHKLAEVSAEHTIYEAILLNQGRYYVLLQSLTFRMAAMYVSPPCIHLHGSGSRH